MNKIIPFNKNIEFNNDIGEITSIALDDNLNFINEYNIKGELIVKGSNKNLDREEDFSYTLPVDIMVDNKYDTSKSKIEIDDFYYEIINDKTLHIKIDLILDNLMYLEENRKIDFDLNVEKKDDNYNVDFNLEKKEDNKTTDLFKEIDDNSEYSVYRVYTVMENDTLDSILEKYQISKEDLGIYNDLNNIKIGMKLIIPSIDE